MGCFTRAVMALFVCAMLVAAVGMFSRGAYGPAAFALGLALFFVAVSVMAIFESKHPPDKNRRSHGISWSELQRYWKTPGWQGKFTVVFTLFVLAFWMISQVVAIFSS